MLKIKAKKAQKMRIGKQVRADFSADYVPCHKRALDLSNTENPLGCSEAVRGVLADGMSIISHYPERGHLKLIKALAKHHDLADSNFFVGNGATGCIQNVVARFMKPGGNVVLPELSFPLPIFASTVLGGCGIKVPVKSDFRIDFDALLQARTADTKLIFICNPNNPTGLYEPVDEILSFARKAKVPVLVSEANIDFSGASLLDCVERWPKNLMVVRTFSKAHGMAAMRIGYGIAAATHVEEINKFQLPFLVSGLSHAAAMVAIEDVGHVKKSVQHICAEREFMRARMQDLGCQSLPPESNTLLAEMPKFVSSVADLVSRLDQKGVTIIDGGAFSAKAKRFVRISMRSRETNEAFLVKMKQVLDEIKDGHSTIML